MRFLKWLLFPWAVWKDGTDQQIQNLIGVSNFSKKREVTSEFQMTVREVSVTLKTLGQAVKCVCESNHDNLASSDWQTHKPTCLVRIVILMSSCDFPSFVQ